MKLKIFLLALSTTLLIFLLIFSHKDIKGNNKAVKCFNDGNFKAASENFNRELEKLPSNYDILNNAAGAEYKLGKFDEAQTKYNSVLNSLDAGDDEKFTALYGLGNIEYSKNDFEKAVNLYKKSLKLNPGDKDAKYNLEAALLKLNEKDNRQNNSKSNRQKDDWRKKQSRGEEGQNDSGQRQNNEEQNLKRQVEQNDKSQKENEKKQRELDKQKGQSAGRQNSQGKDEIQKQQKSREDIEKEKQEINGKIKALKKAGLTGDKAPNGNISREDKRNMSEAMFLNYYDEADKKAGKLRGKNKKLALNQPQEDW
ncbi:tetratricopeptide repeat protein [Candidatus Endomicrobiellum agilis]|uniref:tetratricopeptide repeat protein n=1 Tax=Candidatus Endomicrobiellum agilis TaxID=3238957 RepID=UPI003580CD0F|nr:tetratricopeptide repeat protein [Endomicrobium sp.]